MGSPSGTSYTSNMFSLQLVICVCLSFLICMDAAPKPEPKAEPKPWMGGAYPRYPPYHGGYPPYNGGYPPYNGGYPPYNGGYPPYIGGYRSAGDQGPPIPNEHCFPRDWRSCPPPKNIRISNQDYYGYTTQHNFNGCWNYCKRLRGDPSIGCNAWTFDQTNKVCYTYNTIPACYNAVEEINWVSGSHCG